MIWTVSSSSYLTKVSSRLGVSSDLWSKTKLFGFEGAPDPGRDDVHKILNDIGVGYTHRNEQLIKNNAIEERRVRALLEVM